MIAYMLFVDGLDSPPEDEWSGRGGVMAKIIKNALGIPEEPTSRRY